MHQLTMLVRHALNVMVFVWMKILMIVWKNVFVQLIMIYALIEQQQHIWHQLHNLYEKSKVLWIIKIQKKMFYFFIFSIAGGTPSLTGRIAKQGELILGLYDVNQQRLIDNGGSVFIGDRLFIEIKYRTSWI